MSEFPRSVCIVDDDHDYVAYLERYLVARGCSVLTYASAEDFVDAPEAMSCDFFLLDLTLPGADGVDLIVMIRAHSQAGIVVISGRMGPDAFSNALATGADMFINKPVRFDQVYQAILSVSRRTVGQEKKPKPWIFDARKATLTCPSGQQASLTPTEAKLVACLMRESDGGPLARDELASAAGIAQSKDDRNLDAAMFRLRRHIEDQTNQPAPLKTVHGVGYAMVGVEPSIPEG
jgi:two-component system, OmpR family, response regulator